MILVDTDLVIDVLRGFRPALAWLEHQSQTESLAISGFTAFELVDGCLNKVELRRLNDLLADFEILWLTPDQCSRALAQFTDQRLKFGAGVADTLVARTALEYDFPIHTFNTKHFRQFPELAIVQPYERP